ncbi:MAG TPA: hypothetical protein V6D00_16210, partial [Pantanalinema sp.]
DTHALRRPNGTAPFDAYAGTAPAPEASAGSEAPVRREALAEVIAEAEPLLSTLRPRFAAIARADAANAPDRPSFDVLFEGASEGERTFTLQLARVLSERPEAARLARVALQQFQQAEQDFALAQEAHAQFLAARLEVGQVTGFSATKFRGALYPLYNLCVTFDGVPLLESLFPRSRGPAATRPLNAGGTSPKTLELKPVAPPASPSAMQRFGDWLVRILGGEPPS